MEWTDFWTRAAPFAATAIGHTSCFSLLVSVEVGVSLEEAGARPPPFFRGPAAHSAVLRASALFAVELCTLKLTASER